MDGMRNPLPILTAKEQHAGLFYLLFEVMVLPGLLNGLNGALSHPLSAALVNFLYFSINCIAVISIFGRFLRKNVLRAIHFPKQVILYSLIGFALYWIASSAVTWSIYLIYPDYVNLNDNYIWSMTGTDPIFMIIGTVFLAPIAEEVLHRGLIFGSLHGKNKLLAYFVSVFLFAAIHVVSYIGTYSPTYIALALLQYLPAGLIFAWFYQKSGCIVTPIAIHILNNAVVLITTR